MTDAAEVAARVMARADTLAAISALDGGIGRFYLTDEHARANEEVLGWMRSAGLETWVDALGSVHGRAGTGERPTLLIGSHLDSIPDAGAYDGILGVLLGIEVATWAQAQELPFDVQVIGFAEEEGVRFGATLMTSLGCAGRWDERWLALEDAEGISLAEAMRRFGLDPEQASAASLRNGKLLGYLEAHIEQGPVLDDAGLALGAVTTIYGARRLAVTLHGAAAHAGTTPLRLRRDALATAAEIVLAVERQAAADDVIATVGQLTCAPGAVNVVAGQAVLSIDLRGGTNDARDALEQALLAEIEAIAGRRGVTFDVQPLHGADAAPCDARMLAAVRTGIAAAGCEVLDLPSGAGHDAMVFTGVCPIGMLFVRSPGGVSHHPDECVLVDDVAQAYTALCATLAALA